MSVCCECCVLSGRGLCNELITRPEESYRLWCVVVCDEETSLMRRSWPALGRSATGKKIYIYFLLHFLSPFLVLRLPASFSVFCCINFFYCLCVFVCPCFVCRFLLFMSFILSPVYSVSLCWVMCVSAHVTVFQHLFQGNGANRRTFDSGPRSKLLQYVVSSRRHLKPGASRSRQPNILGLVLRDEWSENICNSPVVNKYTVTPYVVRAVSIGHLISQCQLTPFEQSFPQHAYNFSNRNLRSNCLALPSSMHIYFEWVNTKFLFFLSLLRTTCYHQSPSFTDRYTLYQSYKPLKFTLKLKLKLLLHVSVYDHHQGPYTWA